MFYHKHLRNLINNEFKYLLITNKSIIYLDNSTLTPLLNSNLSIYKNFNLNVLNENYITHKIEVLRHNLFLFLKCSSKNEIIFLKNTTESINFIIQSFFLLNNINNKNIILTNTEHNSNYIPWIKLKQTYSININFFNIYQKNNIKLIKLKKIIDKKTILLSICHVSNILGYINPINVLI